MQMITHCVPTAPGRARLFFAMVTPAAGANALMRFAVTRMPRWLGHFSQHAVLDGDNCFLYMQARGKGIAAPASSTPSALQLRAVVALVVPRHAGRWRPLPMFVKLHAAAACRCFRLCAAVKPLSFGFPAVQAQTLPLPCRPCTSASARRQ